MLQVFVNDCKYLLVDKLFTMLFFCMMDQNKTSTDFTNLTTWQKSRQLASIIYKATESFRDYTLKDQLRRAALSIMNNIAEGYSRNSTKDTQHFFYISLASCSEVRSMTYVMEDLDSLNKETNDIIRLLSIETHKMLHAFIEYLKNK